MFKRFAVSMLGVSLLFAAPSTTSRAADVAEFRGVVTDDDCVNGDHSHMRMGETDAECAVACIDAHGASYVLFDGKSAYTFADQKLPQKFAGQKVTVVGTLDVKTKKIQVSSITAAK